MNVDRISYQFLNVNIMRGSFSDYRCGTKFVSYNTYESDWYAGDP